MPTSKDSNIKGRQLGRRAAHDVLVFDDACPVHPFDGVREAAPCLQVPPASVHALAARAPKTLPE